jgi:hypothetical protein
LLSLYASSGLLSAAAVVTAAANTMYDSNIWIAIYLLMPPFACALEFPLDTRIAEKVEAHDFERRKCRRLGLRLYRPHHSEKTWSEDSYGDEHFRDFVPEVITIK